MKFKLLWAALLLATSPAWAINKCTGPDGKVAFQDAPCQGKGKGELLDVKPASGKGNSSPVAPGGTDAAAAGAAKPLTEAQRIDAQVTASQRERRKADLDERLVPYARDSIYRQRAECEQQLNALKTKKLSARNNLAGATWEGSISAEMAAVATRCDTHNRDLRDEHSALKKECVSLGGCKGE